MGGYCCLMMMMIEIMSRMVGEMVMVALPNSPLSFTENRASKKKHTERQTILHNSEQSTKHGTVPALSLGGIMQQSNSN
jgi:hypothetical protein